MQCISRPQCCRAECCRAETRGWCRLQSPGCCSTAPESGYCSCCRGRPVLGHSELQCGQLVSTSQDIFRVPGLNIVPKSLPKIHDIYVPKSKYHSRAGGSSRQRVTLCHVPAAGAGQAAAAVAATVPACSTAEPAAYLEQKVQTHPGMDRYQ